MSKSVNVDFVTRQIEVDTDGKEYYVSAAVAAKDAEQSMLNAQNAATQSETALSLIQKHKAVWFDSVADMKANLDLTAETYACTAGYYAPNDGGGASYLIRTKADTDVDDGGSLHELSNGLVAELIIENGTVNVKQFGAVGDGVADDSEYVQQAIDYFYSNGTVYIPANISWKPSEVTMKDNVAVIDNSGYAEDTNKFSGRHGIWLNTDNPENKNANGFTINSDYHPWLGINCIGNTKRSSIQLYHDSILSTGSDITLDEYSPANSNIVYKMINYRNNLGGNIKSFMQVIGYPANNEIGFKVTPSIGIDYKWGSSFENDMIHRLQANTNYGVKFIIFTGTVELWRVYFNPNGRIEFENRKNNGKNITFYEDGTIRQFVNQIEGSPNELKLKPKYLGEEVLDTTTNTWYKCCALSAIGWKAMVQ